jgi:hypothetical protein
VHGCVLFVVHGAKITKLSINQTFVQEKYRKVSFLTFGHKKGSPVELPSLPMNKTKY